MDSGSVGGDGGDLDLDLGPVFDQGGDLHRGHRDNWWYYVPEVGQHVAFYSRQTMAYIAAQYGYAAICGRRTAPIPIPGREGFTAIS